MVLLSWSPGLGRRHEASRLMSRKRIAVARKVDRKLSQIAMEDPSNGAIVLPAASMDSLNGAPRTEYGSGSWRPARRSIRRSRKRSAGRSGG